MIAWKIDWRSPYEAFAPLAGEAHAHLLHTGDRAGDGCSVLVAFPSKIIEAGPADGADWLDEVGDIARDRRMGGGDLVPGVPFCSGLVGFVGYEALSWLEPSLSSAASPYDLPAVSFGAYDAAAVFFAA